MWAEDIVKMKKVVQAKELLVKDRSTVVQFMKSDENDELSKLLSSLDILKEDADEKPQ